MRRATRRMRSAPATDEPPNFMTTRGLGMAGILPEGPGMPVESAALPSGAGPRAGAADPESCRAVLAMSPLAGRYPAPSAAVRRKARNCRGRLTRRHPAATRPIVTTLRDVRPCQAHVAERSRRVLARRGLAHTDPLDASAHTVRSAARRHEPHAGDRRSDRVRQPAGNLAGAGGEHGTRRSPGAPRSGGGSSASPRSPAVVRSTPGSSPAHARWMARGAPCGRVR